MFIALQIIGGFILLLIGGELLVRGAVALAKSWGMPTLVIGLTVVAFGTSAPELVVSGKAALDGHAGIALGNVIGSNISNILLVLGIAALIYPIAIDSKLGKFDGISMVLATVLVIAFMMTGGELSLIEGVILLLSLIAYLLITLRNTRRDKAMAEAQIHEIEEQVHVSVNSWQAGGLVAIGIACLVFGADFLVGGAVSLARILGMSEAVIGLTLVAVGSSAPELATSVVAAFRRHSDVAMGNIVGSNLFNLLGILGIASIAAPIDVDPVFIKFDVWVLLAATLVLFGLMRFGKKIGRIMGGILALGYISYIVTLFMSQISAG